VRTDAERHALAVDLDRVLDRSFVESESSG
jgi:hypothetical protein